jgi:hypothetical protein
LPEAKRYFYTVFKKVKGVLAVYFANMFAKCGTLCSKEGGTSLLNYGVNMLLHKINFHAWKKLASLTPHKFYHTLTFQHKNVQIFYLVYGRGWAKIVVKREWASHLKGTVA